MATFAPIEDNKNDDRQVRREIPTIPTDNKKDDGRAREKMIEREKYRDDRSTKEKRVRDRMKRNDRMTLEEEEKKFMKMVKVKDDELKRMIDQIEEKKVPVYGKIEMTKEQNEMIKYRPDFCLYPKITMKDMVERFEVGTTKQR